MTKEKPFYIVGSYEKRPDSGCTIYVDGTATSDFREGVDIELSHWIPNRTEAQYRAPTSTEICFKYLDANTYRPYDLVINNHLDIDGMISVFVMVYPTLSLKHREALCTAAKMGDFWGWGTGKGLNLFQELTHLFMKCNEEKTDVQKAYEICFDLILTILNGPASKSKAESILEEQLALVKNGFIERKVLNERLVTYRVPKGLTKGRIDAYHDVADVNEPISERLAFWPQVRNCLDEEKIQLVAIETEEGTYYDLWYPGYLWADTEGLWRPKGFINPDSMKGPYLIQCPALSKAIEDINAMETGSCTWTLFTSLYLFNTPNPRGFPVVMTTLGGVSHLPVEKINKVLSQLI